MRYYILLAIAFVVTLSAQIFQDASTYGRLSKLINGMSGTWNFIENSGTRYDSSKNNANLLDHGGITRTNVGGYPAAFFTRASSQYLTSTNSTPLATGGKQFEIAAWVSQDSFDITDNQIAAKGNGAGTTAEWYLYYENITHIITFQTKADNGTFTTIRWTNAASVSTRYFVNAYFDPTGNQLGLSVSPGGLGLTMNSFTNVAGVVGHPTASTAADLSFGSVSDGGGYFLNGYIQFPYYVVGRTNTTAQRLRLWGNGVGGKWSTF